jgi:hypothetical protein
VSNVWRQRLDQFQQLTQIVPPRVLDFVPGQNGLQALLGGLLGVKADRVKGVTRR